MGKKKKRQKGTVEREKFLRRVGAEYAEELRVNATPWELEFKEILDKAGISYLFQYVVVCDRNDLFILDFYIPECNVAFELDGAHHYERHKAAEDAVRTRKVARLGIRIKRIRNSNVKVITPEMITSYLKAHKPK